VLKISEDMLDIRRDLTDLVSSLKKQITKLQELISSNMQKNKKPSSPSRSKCQKKLRTDNKGGSYSSFSSMDSRWTDQCATNIEDPCDDNDTKMEASPDGVDVH
jgi:hypothetical protein